MECFHSSPQPRKRIPWWEGNYLHRRSTSWGADISQDNKWVPRLLWNRNFSIATTTGYCNTFLATLIHSTSEYPVPYQSIVLFFSKLFLRFPDNFLPFRFSDNKIMYTILISHAKTFSLFHHHNNISWRIEIRRSSLWEIPHIPFISSLLGANKLSNTLFAKPSFY